MGIHYQSHLGCSFADVEEAWDQAPEPSPDLTSGETPQWGFSLFALQPSPERCSQADPHTLSPSNNSARASVEPVYVPLQLNRTTFDEVEGGWAHAAASAVVSSQPEEPPENVRARPQTETSPEAVLASLQAEALLEPVQVAPLPQELLQPVFVETLCGALRRDLKEDPLRACRCPSVNCSALHLLS